MSETIPTLVRAAVARDPRRVAMWYPAAKGYGNLTYGELGERVSRVARGLAERGIGRGDRVVLLVPMRPELYIVLLATMSLGAVAVFVEPGSHPRELARVIRFVEPRAFIGIPKAHLLRPVFRDIGRVPVRIVVGRGVPGLPAESMSRLVAGPPQAAFERVAPEEPAILTFSSGTTGEPKGAVRSHGFLAAQHRAIVELAGGGNRAADVDLTAFAIGALSCFASGTTAIIPRMGRGGVDDIDADELIELIQTQDVTTLSGAPSFLSALFDRADKRGLRFPSIRRATSGGAPVSAALCKTAARLLPRARFSVVYGSTEAEPIAVIDGPDLAARGYEGAKRGAGLCVGRVHQDVVLKLVRLTEGPIEVDDVGDVCVEPGQVGEVVVSGPHVNERYYKNPSAERSTKICDASGTVWHRTGDTAYLDANDTLWIVGRRVDTISAPDGSLLHPASVEALAQGIGFVDRAALVADAAGAIHLVVQPHNKRDLVAWTLSRPHRRAMKRELTSALGAGGIAVDHIHLVPKVPVDSRHRSKIDYKRVRATLPLLRWIP